MLQRRRQEEEEKRQERWEIELNKRPPGTKILVEEERQELMDKLQAQRAELVNQQQRMSVTHYTIRAKNQYMDFVEKIDQIDKSIKVLERKKFVMRAD